LKQVTRLKAFSAHLGISLIIFLIMLYVIVMEWYPPPLFSLDGGWQGIRLIAAVDIILGPCLTLIVFKPGKPGLKFDLAVIACIQTAALIYGAWVVQNERPYAAVFVEDRFYTITGTQLIEANMEKEDLMRFGPDLPVLIYSHLPEDEEELFKLRWQAFGSQRPLYFLSEYYETMDKKFLDKILLNALDMESLLANRPQDLKLYQNYAASQDKELHYFPIHSRHSKPVIVSFDLNNWSLEDALDIAAPELRVTSAEEELSKIRSGKNPGSGTGNP